MGLLAQLIRGSARVHATDTGVVFAIALDAGTAWFADCGPWADVSELEQAMNRCLADGALGELDWHDVGCDGRELLIYAVGPDPDELFEALYPVIVSRGPAPQGSYARLRYGANRVPTRIML
jgi:hypothetical protein